MTREQIVNLHPTDELLGVPISLLDMDATLAQVQRFCDGDESHLVVTADATALVIATDSPDFRALLGRASLITPDGAGVQWALRRRGHPDVTRVSGVDLVARICALSAERGWRIAFVGAEPGIAERAAERLRLRYPGCNIVGARHGYFPAESDSVVAEELAALRPDILFVGMGMPRQERFILETQGIIKFKVAMGVGGSFDVLSGKTRRAPKVFQRFHMEWLWRLMMDPSKISKVKVLPRFVRLVLRERA